MIILTQLYSFNSEDGYKYQIRKCIRIYIIEETAMLLLNLFTHTVYELFEQPKNSNRTFT